MGLDVLRSPEFENHNSRGWSVCICVFVYVSACLLSVSLKNKLQLLLQILYHTFAPYVDAT